MERICIVVPMYNEAERIIRTLTDLKKKREYDSIVVVDDGSSDGGTLLVRRTGIPLIELPLHLGYGVTVQTGLAFAYENGYDYAVTFDADGQHEASSIEGLLSHLKKCNADIVIGSRFLERSFRTSFVKRSAILFFSLVTRMATGLKITDPTSGFIAFSRCGMQYYMHDNLPHKFPDTDALIMFHRAGVKLSEAPVVMYPSPRKSMHYGLNALWYMANMIFSVAMSLLRKKELK